MTFSVSTPSTTSVSTATATRVDDDAPKKLFIEISSATRPQDLRALLEDNFGRTVHINTHTNKYGRTMAFVSFRYHEHAVRALEELQGHRLDGLILHPQWATPRWTESSAKKNHRRVSLKHLPVSIVTVKETSGKSEKNQWHNVASKRTKNRPTKA